MDSSQATNLNFIIKNVEIREIVGDVLCESADALIFPANPDPEVGGSMDKVISESAKKKEIWKNRKKLNIGEACATESGELKNYKWLIHAVAPKKDDQDILSIHAYTLIQTYKSALEAAKIQVDKDTEPITVVSALLGAGANGFSLDQSKAAARIAVTEFFEKECNRKKFKRVTFVEYQEEDDERYLREFHEHLKQAAQMLEDGRVKNWNWESYLNMQIGTHIEKLAAAFKYEETSDEVEQYFNYCTVRKSGDKGSYEDYKFSVYDKLVHSSGILNNRVWRNELEHVFYEDYNTISSMLNCNGHKNKHSKSVLNCKERVLKIGLGLCLTKNDYYQLVLSCGHVFPYDERDRKILEVLDKAIGIEKGAESREIYFQALRDLFPEEPFFGHSKKNEY